jgi:hypothetical protein
MSETVVDVTNRNFESMPRRLLPHQLEEPASQLDDFSLNPLPRGEEDTSATQQLQALNPEMPAEPEEPATCPPPNQMYSRPVGDTDVFVNDFTQLGQGGPRRLKALRGHLLRAIDQVLAQPTAKETHQNKAVLLKKLLKGDGS